MNVVRLMGGLGNQLFQYAFGQAMKAKGTEVAYDISNFGKSKHREYMLGNFKLDIKFSTFINNKGCLDTGANPSFNMDYLRMDGKNFFGYWQYIEYIRDIIPILQNEVWVKEEAYTDEFCKYRDIISSKQSIGVHVRRDDYLTSNTIPVLPFSYYYEAITEIKGDLFIFSDDIEWCKRYFKEVYFERELNFIHLPYYQDFELMRMCKHQIIANSTFSYWTALLNTNPDKIVITPDFWITKLDKAKRNNFPQNWVKLNVNV